MAVPGDVLIRGHARRTTREAFRRLTRKRAPLLSVNAVSGLSLPQKYTYLRCRNQTIRTTTEHTWLRILRSSRLQRDDLNRLGLVGPGPGIAAEALAVKQEEVPAFTAHQQQFLGSAALHGYRQRPTGTEVQVTRE